jgi:hypothetical protein
MVYHLGLKVECFKINLHYKENTYFQLVIATKFLL